MARRIVPARGAGLNKQAPFWKGDTAEKIIAARRAERAAEVEARRVARASRGGRGTRGRTSTKGPASSAGVGAPAPAARRLRRLERALGRRKTLAARQRVQARIDALRKELEL